MGPVSARAAFFSSRLTLDAGPQCGWNSAGERPAQGGEQGLGPHVKKGGLEVNVYIPTILRILIINNMQLC